MVLEVYRLIEVAILRSQASQISGSFSRFFTLNVSSSLKVAGSAEQWCRVSRFSHLMAVRIEGRRQRGAVVHRFRGVLI